MARPGSSSLYKNYNTPIQVLEVKVVRHISNLIDAESVGCIE